VSNGGLPRPLNVFFDVDNTLIMWNGKLRPHTRDVFEALRNEGHKIYIWSGVGIRRWDMKRHELQDYVEDYFVKPLDRYRERAYTEFKVNVPIDYVIDDHPAVIDAFDHGYYIADELKPNDRELLDVLDQVRALALQPPLPGRDDIPRPDGPLPLT